MGSEIHERALIIMAKAARVGQVKTRLAASLPADAVMDLYKCLIEDTLDLARSVSTDAVAIVCPTSDVSDLACWLPAVEIVGQQGEGLAAGLVSAFRIFIGRGYRRIVALDGDSPQLAPDTLENAFRLLDRADVVVGPTTDGGYYLVGSTSVQAELFDTQGIGTGRAFDSLMAGARGLGLRVALTETGYDVDEAEDLARLARELRFFPHRAPRTAAWLARQSELRGW
ncbi:MAG: TIGR04282 family arsenosugar biosynthesis glycosyltransferase [Deltaproteobacteria bacterium]|nr:TIGR04282 family arsenosugar biosynthesis glycosyltransferase [Deltaproteobacteria bacterium]